VRNNWRWQALPCAAILGPSAVVAALSSGPSGPSGANLFTVGEAVFVLSDGRHSHCVHRPRQPSDAEAGQATA